MKAISTIWQRSEQMLRYLRGELNAAEEAELKSWLKQHPEQQELLDQLLNDKGLDADLDYIARINQESAWSELKSRLDIDAVEPVVRVTRLWPRIVAVAAAVALIVLGVYFFSYRNNEILKQVQDDVVVNDVAPGKNTATIKIGDGEAITLSGAKKGVVIGDDLRYNDGSKINGRHHEFISGSQGSRGGGPDLRQDDVGVKRLTVTTPRGGTYQVTLPDGTQARLNADSKITFPSRFTGQERRVKLEGEAYFKVVHNARQPFRVESRGQVVEDIGTEFNINAYTDEAAIKTTLVEGLARVFLLPPPNPLLAKEGSMAAKRDADRRIANSPPAARRGAEGGVVLNPNQQSALTGNALTVGVADPSATAWVNGKFRFNNTPVAEVMKQVARWYDVDVVYPQGVPDESITGDFNRNINASQALKILQIVRVKFKIEGKKIIVSQ